MGNSTDFIWTQWHGHLEALIGLTILQIGYLIGVGPLRKYYRLSNETDPRQIAIFTCGVLVIFVALVSPLHVLSDNFLFSAHMLQHLLLTLVVPPLLILGTPYWLLQPILRPNIVLKLARLSTNPIVAFSVFNIVFAIWHIPELYNTSVTNHSVHVTEHLLFVTTAVLMWWPVTSNVPEIPRLSYPLSIVYFFMLSIAQLIVFAPITFASKPLYEWYIKAPQIWSVSTLVDQQIGAIIMKIGGGLLFMTMILVTFFRWYNHDEQEAEK